jgi:ribosomal protein S19E (S16A)
METPEIPLSSSERSMLAALAGGVGLDEIAPDWVALQRLRQFGLIDEVSQGHKVTPAGRRVLASGQGPDTKA